ncbi:MAG: DedA family protein [Candidatus Micrarchaeia archaeon]|jgi:membrane-associated protein
MLDFFDITQVLVSFGYLALFLIVFAETGLLIGFFLPGDTLLFTAGLLAAQGVLGLPETILVCFVAAVIGDSFGYYLGHKFGKRVFEKKGHFLSDYLNKENLEKTREFYAKYGDWTIFLARFVPVVRTIAPTMAGTGDMPYPTFISYNVFGGLAWVLVATLAGFFLGALFPNAVQVLSALMLLIIAASIAPLAWKMLGRKMKK